MAAGRTADPSASLGMTRVRVHFPERLFSNYCPSKRRRPLWVIPSEAEGSAVQRALTGKVFCSKRQRARAIARAFCLIGSKILLRKGMNRSQGFSRLGRLRLGGWFLWYCGAASGETAANGRILGVVGSQSQADQGATVWG